MVHNFTSLAYTVTAGTSFYSYKKSISEKIQYFPLRNFGLSCYPVMGRANRETFVADTKCFWTKSETFFVSRTQNLCPQQMLRARANGETFVSATMWPQQCVLVCQGLNTMTVAVCPAAGQDLDCTKCSAVRHFQSQKVHWNIFSTFLIVFDVCWEVLSDFKNYVRLQDDEIIRAWESYTAYKIGMCLKNVRLHCDKKLLSNLMRKSDVSLE